MKTSFEKTLRMRFHKNVRELKKLAKENGWKLKNFNEAEVGYMCVLSDRDYEIGSTIESCDENNENYFMSQSDYDEYLIATE